MAHVGYLTSFAIWRSRTGLLVRITPTCPIGIIDYGARLAAAFPRTKFALIDQESPGYRLVDGELESQSEYSYTYGVGGRVLVEAALEAALENWRLCVEIKDSLDESIALDFHTLPIESGEETSFPRTEIGQLLYEAKYSGSTSSLQKLGDLVLATFEVHPRLASIARVAFPPPTDGRNKIHVAQSIATRVAETIGKALVMVERIRAVQAQKAMPNDLRQRRANVLGSLRVTEDLTFEDVVVFDDVYMSGETLAELGRACSAAGAFEVLGFSITKTPTFSQSADYGARTLKMRGI